MKVCQDLFLPQVLRNLMVPDTCSHSLAGWEVSKEGETFQRFEQKKEERDIGRLCSKWPATQPFALFDCLVVGGRALYV